MLERLRNPAGGHEDSGRQGSRVAEAGLRADRFQDNPGQYARGDNVGPVVLRV